MAGTVYVVADCGDVDARGEYVESTIHFAHGYPIYINSDNDALFIVRTSASCAIDKRTSGTGYSESTGVFDQRYYGDNTLPDQAVWSTAYNNTPLPTVTLKSGSVEPASNMVLASFL